MSSSADRTVIIRDRISRDCDGRNSSAFLTVRVVTLKASPTSIALLRNDTNTLIVSTTDRHVLRINALTGAILDFFKVSDPDSDDTVSLNRIAVSGTYPDAPSQLLIGYSSNDKSVRVYDLQKNLLLTRESGHTEGISDLALIEQEDEIGGSTQCTVVSTGLDGTIMIWDLKHQPQSSVTPIDDLSQGQALTTKTSRGASPASLPPMRKILSKLNMADLARIDPTSGSPVPVRGFSPSRLQRKPSQLTLMANGIPQDSTPQLPTSQISSHESTSSSRTVPSSTPSRTCVVKLQQARSRTSTSCDGREQRSPSVAMDSPSTPNTPRCLNRPNNGRLRRPPSVPIDLRSQATSRSRRSSVSNVHDFGSVGMATDQACRMLRSYRKRLQHAQAGIDIQAVEEELLDTLETVRKRTALSTVRNVSQKTPTAIPDQDKNVGQLSAMLEEVGLTDEEPGTSRIKHAIREVS